MVSANQEWHNKADSTQRVNVSLHWWILTIAQYELANCENASAESKQPTGHPAKFRIIQPTIKPYNHKTN